MVAPKPKEEITCKVTSGSYFSLTTMEARLLAKSTECSSTHGREARALLMRPTQVTLQFMPVTLMLTSLRATGVTVSTGAISESVGGAAHAPSQKMGSNPKDS